MTIGETGAVLFSEVVFKGFFSRSAIIRKCARADLASAIVPAADTLEAGGFDGGFVDRACGRERNSYK
jgi:hypothetical protein